MSAPIHVVITITEGAQWHAAATATRHGVDGGAYAYGDSTMPRFGSYAARVAALAAARAIRALHAKERTRGDAWRKSQGIE